MFIFAFFPARWERPLLHSSWFPYLGIYAVSFFDVVVERGWCVLTRCGGLRYDITLR